MKYILILNAIAAFLFATLAITIFLINGYITQTLSIILLIGMVPLCIAFFSGDPEE